ncbi:flagellar hook-basal body complex protein FliE [Cellulomonas fimi]|uniref:Flagellar hook-basal body complex protein FliE n=1 Tax=Cellulomonas fimi (strain ATCC 484 / DSM 20113 / JCM 1341 / CCUG 24087 / LMG 16345 / NBRC 15513 / NCIMB 8980 / NCTC 7547 / NRS-133) TaxID=590998 RepID=F4GYU1_CELFA|nr:flagellar hook-basal body complex protein FliE [Cellulomonas fimi]AEE44810.1 flagellar hook-basal body complex subunit FliE [Cellulomonas fimi ATCC 484]NNH08374.1 flagellar hook-basal body complex protein FliE [Cellulomonas fimi]VEH27355.1 flagellar hook-basal body protein FliE [Cellulomonas fimi]
MTFAVTPVTGVLPTGALGAALPTQAADPAAGAQFASVLGAVENLQQMQSTSNELAVRAVTGDLDDVHDYTIASAQASTALELTAAVRNKAVDAFTEIMRMQA